MPLTVDQLDVRAQVTENKDSNQAADTGCGGNTSSSNDEVPSQNNRAADIADQIEQTRLKKRW